MSVNSFYFPVFLADLYVLYYLLCPVKLRWGVLLAGSLFFYLTACAVSPVYLLISAGSIWIAGMALEHCSEKYRRRWIYLAGILSNLGILLVLKYSGFFIRMMNEAPGLKEAPLPMPHFMVPLGISYYTLMGIGYLTDVYKGKLHAERNPAMVVLFLCFFGQITQGPIGRFKRLGNQFRQEHRWNYEDLAQGCSRILWGFFKKTVIADRMQPVAATIFANYENYGGMTCLLGCIYMTVQAYTDFSGYMDIVVGAARLFGIRLEENFRQPFFSRSVAEFWRRWHITLGGWFRDYLFYPLAISAPAVRFGKLGRKWFGIRVGKLFPSLFALIFVWSLTGLWHDASFRYVLWGLVNGVCIMGAMILEPWFSLAKKKLHVKEKGRGWNGFCMVRTFLLVSLMKVFPGAATTGDSLRILGKIFADFRLPRGLTEWVPGMGRRDVFLAAAAVFVLLAADWMAEQGRPGDRTEKMLCLAGDRAGKMLCLAGDRAGRILCWAGYLGLLAAILFFGEFGNAMVGGFAYAQY